MALQRHRLESGERRRPQAKLWRAAAPVLQQTGQGSGESLLRHLRGLRGLSERRSKLRAQVCREWVAQPPKCREIYNIWHTFSCGQTWLNTFIVRGLA